MTGPAVTVVVATAGRGALIEPTLESVRRQTVDDIEVIVSSDGPAAPGLEHTVAAFDERFRLVETATRWGSQDAPNNHAWSLAAGACIAYLGHDDIWLPNHLAAILTSLRQHPDADFVASGCLYFGPPGSGPGHTWVTGLFDSYDRRMARTHFFPPSSVAHRRALPSDLRWPDARSVRRPVDSQFMLDAARGGSGFASTRQITVLKFNSALRYLSYLSPDADEQWAALALIDDPERLEATVAAAADEAASSGNYMTTLHPSEGDRQPGEPARTNAVLRGIIAPAVRPLEGPTWVPVGDDPRAFDWYSLETNGVLSWRWSGPNPRPRLVIPFSHDGPVRITLHLQHVATEDVLDSLEILVDRCRVEIDVQYDAAGILVACEGVLRNDRPTVLELRMRRTVAVAEFVPGSTDARRLGVALNGIHLDPSDDGGGPLGTASKPEQAVTVVVNTPDVP